jgi:Putative Ig domain
LVIIASLLGGCSKNPAAGTSTADSANSMSTPLAMSGTPPGSVAAGSNYSFQPEVSQSGTTVAFSISGAPSWAAFNNSTGELSGTPTDGDVGTTVNITITASEGSSTATIGPFSIIVTPPAGTPGSALVSWAPPTQNTNGSVATDITGYYIYYGTSADSLTQTIAVAGGGTTSFVIDELAPGTYYFSVAAYTSQGTESAQSEVASTTI